MEVIDLLDSKCPLTRLIIRFPLPLYETLKSEAQTQAVPMAIVVRQLVAEWAANKAAERRAVSP